MQQEINTLRSREMDADDIADYSEDRAKLKAENDRLKAIDRDREIEIGDLNGKLKRYEFEIDQLKLAKTELVEALNLVDELLALNMTRMYTDAPPDDKFKLKLRAMDTHSKIETVLAKHRVDE